MGILLISYKLTSQIRRESIMLVAFFVLAKDPSARTSGLTFAIAKVDDGHGVFFSKQWEQRLKHSRNKHVGLCKSPLIGKNNVSCVG